MSSMVTSWSSEHRAGKNGSQSRNLQPCIELPPPSVLHHTEPVNRHIHCSKALEGELVSRAMGSMI